MSAFASLLPGPVRPQSVRRKYRLVRRIAGQVTSNVLQREADVRQVRLVPEQTFKAALHRSIDLLERNGGLQGDYLEFGVYNGTSLSCAYEVLQQRSYASTRLFGFDSFRGLPWSALAERHRVWVPGQYRCSLPVTRRLLDERGVDWNRVALIKGWFDETLTPATADTYGIRRASIVMIDCDIYSSAIKALTFTGPLMADESIIIFDDWYSVAKAHFGEQQAFSEFLQAHPGLAARPVDAYNDTSLVFHVRRLGGARGTVASTAA